MRNVLITGASGALGVQMAEHMTRNGYNVIHCYNTTPVKLSDKQQMVVKCDITSEHQVTEMMEQIKQKYDRLDCVINNAGIHIDSPVWKTPKDDWDKVINTNLTGSFLCIKHAIPLMREHKFGRIVNVSSVVGQRGGFGVSNYSASKAGLFGLTKAVAVETARYNITCNTIALGYFVVGMINDIPMEIQKNIRKNIPMQRFGVPSELNGLLLYMLSDNASYLTGQTIGLNGGCYM